MRSCKSKVAHSNKGQGRGRAYGILPWLALLSLMLIVGACGTNNGPSDASEAASTTEQASAPNADPATTPADSGSEQAEATIKHDYGETTIPANPKRIVSIGMEDMLLSLDVPLVQAFSTDGYYLDAQIKEKGIPINSSFDINLEAIAAAAPDLIIMNTYMTDQAGYEQISKIAPTIAFIRDNWQSVIVDIGRALGKEDAAQSVLQSYRDQVEQAKASIVQAVGEGKTVAFIRPSTKDVELDFPEWTWTAALYNDLGLSPDPKVLEFQQSSADDWGGTMLSLEKLPELTADYLFMDYGSSMASESDFQQEVAKSSEVEKMNVWKAIPAVAQGHAFKVSARHWALNGPIADGMKIDDVVQTLTAIKQ
ncbi:ABC transporter substrate-binding protein [Cohnella fermenti]|uniref:Iron-siderophore ABC transporter substrate-binding protein n=1 Tax=Cohnella fermenti TaxID=2565925 RepID=A0A4S4BJL1_9BACL|nr:iron-siderophore ABC transporter substrate-binding protein [Cohnella fermenti]THF74841.1 iron-siderophore ABC transporter substrate-binding protein [Cohnella fermenti]